MLLSHAILRIAYVADQLVNWIHSYILLLAHMLRGLQKRASEGRIVLQLLAEGGRRRGRLVLATLELGLEVVLVEGVAAGGRCTAGWTNTDCAANRNRGARLRAMAAAGHGSYHAG